MPPNRDTLERCSQALLLLSCWAPSVGTSPGGAEAAGLSQAGRQAASSSSTASSPRAQCPGPAFGAICVVCGWGRCSHCKPSRAVPSPASDTLLSLRPSPKSLLSGPLLPISLPAGCSVEVCAVAQPSRTSPRDVPQDLAGSRGARLPSPLRLSSSAPAALRKLHKYSWQTEGNVTVPADYTRPS